MKDEKPGQLWRPMSIAIDSDTNNIYVVDGSDSYSRLSIFTDTGEFFKAFPLDHMKCPYGLAIYKNKVYVTDIVEHSVFNFKVAANINFVSRLGGEGDGIGQFKIPKQLTVSTDGDIFITDRNNNRIQILDSNLRYRRCISHKSMLRPCDVKLTPNEVYVLCRANPCVHIFSYSGEKIRSLITCGARMQITAPSIFCLDLNQDLIITDLGTHQIKFFSKEGQLLRTLGGLGRWDFEVGKFYSLHGIGLANSSKLVVASCSSYFGLKIFYRL